MATMLWFKQSKGLATRFDPARILYDPEIGVTYLAEAYNVDFDFTGAIFRRKGFEETGITGDCHSLFWNGGECLFVRNNALCLLAGDLSYTVLRDGISSGKKMQYAQVGDAIVYCNGVQNGVVRGGKDYTYIMPPKTYYPDQTKVYNNPPLGSIVKTFAGRTWIAGGNTLWYSEPFGPNLFRLSANYLSFPSKIAMVAPVFGGLFVGTGSKVYFLQGTIPSQMIQTVVAHYPVIEGTDCEVDGIVVSGGKVSPTPMQMFATTKGICVGTAEGQLINLTYEVLEYPSSRIGSAVCTGDKYIVCLGEGSDKLTICLSLNRVAISQYANYNFNGLCRFNDITLGGNSNGLYRILTGDTDGDSNTTIDAHFRTGPTGFGVENEKKLRKIYCSMRSTGRMKFAVSADGKEDVVRDVTPHDAGLRIIHQEIAGGRDIRGKYLDLKVSNVQGSDFTITEIRNVMIITGAKTTEVM
jgi:hypothetical protein